MSQQEALVVALRGFANEGASPDARARLVPLLDAAGLGDLADDITQIADAELLLSLVDGASPDPIARSIRAALEPSDTPDLAASIMSAVGAAPLPNLADAITSESGDVSVADAVLAAVAPSVDLDAMHMSALLDDALEGEARVQAAARLGHDAAARRAYGAWVEAGRLLRDGLRREADQVSVWDQVSAAIGLASPEHEPGYAGERVASAIRAEASTFDRSDAIMAIVAPSRAPASTSTAPSREVGGRWVLALMASLAISLAILMAVFTPKPDPSTLGVEGFVEAPLDFATANEISVEQVTAGQDASVFVEMPADSEDPVIIWVNDGGVR